MEKKQILIIFIAIIMIASIIGFAVTSSQNTNKTNTNTEQKPSTEEPVLEFSASNVEGTINSLLFSGLIIGCTSKQDLTEINRELLKIKTIKAITSSMFFKEPRLCNNLGFRAEMVFDSNTDFSLLSNEVQEKAGLSNIVIYRKAIVKIPQNVKLKGAGIAADLNITKDFNFSQPFVEAFVEPNTLEKDNVLVDLQLQLKGNQIVSVNAFVSQNLSLYSFHEIERTTKLFSLEKKIVFELKNAEYDGFNTAEIEARLKDLNEVSNALIKVSDLSKFSVIVNYSDLNSIDFNKLEFFSLVEEKLKTLPEIKSIELSEPTNNSSTFRVLIDWNTSVNLIELQNKIKELLFSFGLKEKRISITNPVATIQGEIDITVTETKELADKINKLLFPRIVPELHQLAKIAFSKLEDQNEFFYAEEPIDAVILTGHSMLDDINFTIRFAAERDKIVQALAIEKGLK